jgi:hypothetical protein
VRQRIDFFFQRKHWLFWFLQLVCALRTEVLLVITIRPSRIADAIA